MLAGFKPGSSGVGSNCATTTAPVFSYTAPKPSSFQFTSFSLSVFTAKVLFVMFFKHFARYALFIFCSLNCLPFNLISLSLSLSLLSQFWQQQIFSKSFHQFNTLLISVKSLPQFRSNFPFRCSHLKFAFGWFHERHFGLRFEIVINHFNLQF